jgi:hypothetical protein
MAGLDPAIHPFQKHGWPDQSGNDGVDQGPGAIPAFALLMLLKDRWITPAEPAYDRGG